MVGVIIIPLAIVAVVGIAGYVIYHFILYDYRCNRSVNQTLRKYNITKTQFQIIKEYHESKGEKLSEKEKDSSLSGMAIVMSLIALIASIFVGMYSIYKSRNK